MLNLVLGVGVFSLLPSIFGFTCVSFGGLCIIFPLELGLDSVLTHDLHAFCDLCKTHAIRLLIIWQAAPGISKRVTV